MDDENPRVSVLVYKQKLEADINFQVFGVIRDEVELEVLDTL